MIRSRAPTESLIPPIVLEEGEIIVNKRDLEEALYRIRDDLAIAYLAIGGAGNGDSATDAFTRREMHRTIQICRERLTKLGHKIDDTKDNERLDLT